MKKILGLFVIGILLVMLSSCGKNNIGHTHDLVQVGAKTATCMESGYDAYEYCKSCDYTTYNEISALGHNLTHHEALDATCTEEDIKNMIHVVVVTIQHMK